LQRRAVDPQRLGGGGDRAVTFYSVKCGLTVGIAEWLC
jgi:hypothetical protein